MAAGLVPLLSEIEPFRALVARTGVGRTLPQGDPAAAARAVLAAHADWSRIGTPPEIDVSAALGGASWAEVARRYLDDYETVLGPART